MTEPVLTVSWDNHASKLASVCRTLLEKNYFVDCTIAAEGKSLKAHRLILSACSPYFHMRFSAESDTYPIVNLKDTLFDTLKMMMDFVYNGKADIPANKFETFLELAVFLQINGLKNTIPKHRGTDIGSNAEGNAGQWASRAPQSMCKVESPWTNHEGSFSNSSQPSNFHLEQGYTDMQRESSVPFIKSSNSCEMVQSGAIRLQDHQSRRMCNDTEMSVNKEISVKYLPLDSEIQILETESKIPDYGKRDKFTHANFMTTMADESRPSFGQNLDHHSGTQRESSVPRIKSTNYRKVVQSGAVIYLKCQESHTLNNNEMSDNTETRVEYSQLDSDIEIIEIKKEISEDGKQDESTSANLKTRMTDESCSSFGQNEHQNSSRVPLGTSAWHYHVRSNGAEGPSSEQDEQQATQQRRRRPRRANKAEAGFSPKQLKEHVRLMRNASFTSTSSQGLGDHRRQHSGEEPNLSDPATHQPKHTAERTHTSDGRKKAIHHSRALPVHKQSHKGEKTYLCDVCGKAFTHHTNYAAHKRLHTGEKPYKCDVCAKAFTQLGQLGVHKRLHTGEKPYPCDVCGKAFSRSGHLAVHNRIHTGEKPYQCNVCRKAFRESGQLAAHKRLHTGEKPYSCDVCGEAFAWMTSLVLHKFNHTGEKPYHCNVCGKAFRESGQLAAHKRLHTGEKSYPCNLCGKAFRTSQQLAVHKRRHTGVKPYTCDVCGKAFIRSWHLFRHKRLHTGEKPYSCDVCGKAFKRSDALTNHKGAIKGSCFFDCDACSLRLFRKTEFITHWRSCHEKQ